MAKLARISARYVGNAPPTTVTLREARHILDQARGEALALHMSARKRCATHILRLRQRARVAAYRQGYTQGLMDSLDAQLDAQAHYERLVSRANRDCLELTLEIAREVAKEQCVKSIDGLAQRIQLAIDRLIESRGSKVYVHPSKLSACKEALKELSMEKLALVTDENLSPANARIETVSGTLEVDWQSHFSQLAGKLRSSITTHVQNSLVNSHRSEAYEVVHATP